MAKNVMFYTNRPIAIGFSFKSSFKKIIMTSLIVGLDIFFICHKLTFILCGAMTTNEIIGFLYVLIASPWNQYVIIKLFKGWIEWNSLLQKVYSNVPYRFVPRSSIASNVTSFTKIKKKLKMTSLLTDTNNYMIL